MLKASYDRIAGGSVERLAALSDGIFAVAMTLLALEIRLPATEVMHGERELLQALAHIAPQILIYLMSFVTLGIFWVGQQSQLNHLERSDIRLTWLHLGFLFAVTLMPFSTKLLAEFVSYRTALLGYWLNIFVFGLLLYVSWRYSTRAKLVREDIPAEVPVAIYRRIVVAQAFYAFGAVLCVFSTYWSIAVIVLVQLRYAVWPWFQRKSSA